MLVNELSDGIEIDQVLLVREAERRQRRDGGEYLRLQLGDRTGAVVCMVWEELAGIEELACAGARGARARALHRAPALRPADQPARSRRGRARQLRARGPARRPRARGRADGGRGARAARHDPGAASADAAGARVRRGLGAVGRLPRRAGGQVLPPGLPPRAARALPRRGPGGERDQRDLRGHRPRRGGHGRAAARHRQARGLHRAMRAIRSST